MRETREREKERPSFVGFELWALASVTWRFILLTHLVFTFKWAHFKSYFGSASVNQICFLHKTPLVRPR